MSGTNESCRLGGQRDSTSVEMEVKDPNPPPNSRYLPYYTPVLPGVFFPDGLPDAAKAVRHQLDSTDPHNDLL